MEEVEERLRKLSRLDLSQLREEWFLLFYSEAAGTTSAKLLRLGVAYKIQEIEYDASKQCNIFRQMAAASPDSSDSDGYGYAQHVRPGARLLREYDGKIHEVLAVDNGRFVYAGQVFRSLSAVALAITGVKRSGATFFGLKGKSRRSING
jgi:hypothetical protein